VKIPQCTPGEGRKDDHIGFSYWRGITGGQKHFAYVAGAPVWLICHPSDKGTKPCLHWMTKGALPCRFCHASKMPQEGGYLPVWAAVNWSPKLLFLYGDEREHVEKLELHNRVIVGREVGKGERLYVRLAMNQEPTFDTTDPRKKVSRDITHSLLLMWKLPELVEWLARASDNALSPTPVPLKSDGKEFDPMHQAAAKRATAKGATDGAATDDYTKIVNRVKDKTAERDALKNGHKK